MIIAIIIAIPILLAIIATVVSFIMPAGQSTGETFNTFVKAPSIGLPSLDIIRKPSFDRGAYEEATYDDAMYDSAVEEIEMESSVNTGSGLGTAVPEPNGTLADEEFSNTEQKILKNGSITAQVDNAEETAEKITNLASRLKGFTQSSNIYESSTGAKSGTIVIRIPVNSFEAAFSEIKTLATVVVSESVSGQDVTEQYVDMQSRLKNKQAEETQYLEILEQASDIEDILMVTEYLGWVRQEIEQLQGRLNYLENLTSMSTITAFISEDEKIQIPVDKWRPIETVRLSFRAMIAGLQGLSTIAIWLVMFAALIALPIGIVVFIIIWIIKKIRHRK